MRRVAMPALFSICAFATAARATPEVYTVEPAHTYPSFQAPHQGISHWLGKFNKTSGKIWLDREHGTGSMHITIETGSINFGMPLLEKIMAGPDYFDVANYPTATYDSDSITFANGVPSAVDGRLTIRGITKPVKLQILSFTCKQHPLFKREICGGDARGEFDRTQFSLTKAVEGDPNVSLIIQVEALQGDALPPMPSLPGAGARPPEPPQAPPR
jgi:polyisoprenoid-binding protein YceI